MLVNPLKSDVIRPGDPILEFLSKALDKHGVRLRNTDILAVSSKVVGISEERVRDLDSARPAMRALKLARRYSMDPRFVQIVLDEADTIIGGVRGALLTVKNGDAVANAGIDQKNAPPHSVVLWPINPDGSARRIRSAIRKFFGKDVGVVIVDSRVSPLRLGTTGFAIGTAGVSLIKDLRGDYDLSGRKVRMTLHGLADGIAAAAQLVMGEGHERTPLALIRDGPAAFRSLEGVRSTKLPWNHCLYMSQIKKSGKIAR